MIELFKKVNSGEPVDYILFPGDAVGHKLALKPG